MAKKPLASLSATMLTAEEPFRPPAKRTHSIQTVKIPYPVYVQLKGELAASGMTFQDLALELVEDWIRRQRGR